MPRSRDSEPRPVRLLRALLPDAERDEVLGDLREEHAAREARQGRGAARLWLWTQVLVSLPLLAWRSCWRGWSGFEPRANRYRPGGPRMESLVLDVRYVLRRLRLRPTYALLAVLTLALGVGGTSAIFAIVRALLLEPLPYRSEEELAVFWNPFDWSEAEMEHLRPEWPGFRRVAAYRTEDVTVDMGGGPPRLVPGVASSAELLEVLGVSPAAGPGFRPGDDRVGAEPTVVLSHALWRELGADPSVVGRRLRLDGVQRTVVGVMPRGFWFPDPTVKVWLSTPMRPDNRSGNYALVGRMPPGSRIEGMGGALAQITARLAEQFQYSEQWDKTKNAELTPLREYLIGPVRPSLLASLAAMAVILLIACANVATLALGQVDSRSTELAVRTALGAERRRLVQQLVVESVVIGVAAGVVGAQLAAVGHGVLTRALPLGPLAESAALDWSVFWVAMLVALGAALAVALLPALSLWRGDVRGTLTTSRTGGIAGRGGRVEGGLVVAEVALAVLVAAGAGLLIRSVSNLRAIDPGVETEGVAVVDVAMAADVEGPERRRLLQEVLRSLEELPGVASVGATQRLVLRGGGDSWGIQVEGRPDQARSSTYFRMVTPGYFRTLGIELKRGRLFDASDPRDGRGMMLYDSAQAAAPDAARAEPVVVINEALAKKYFPGEDPVGRRLLSSWNGERIVGVVEDVAEGKLTDQREPARYMLYEQVPGTPEGHALLLKLHPGADAAATLEAARRTVQRVAPGMAVEGTTTMEQVFTQALGPARQVMSLLTLLGALALVLGAVGVYGIVSHFVTRRRRDWGIRIALGLAPHRVVAQVVRRGGGLVAGGVALGLAAFLALARLLATFLYGVGAADPLALAAATATLLAAGLLAAFIPARRASRIDPAVTLREQ